MHFQWTFDIQRLDSTEWKTQWQSQINFLQPVKWIFRKLNEHFQTCLRVHIIWQVGEGLLEFTAKGRAGDKTSASESCCFQAWPSHCLSQGPTKSFYVILGLSFSFIPVVSLLLISYRRDPVSGLFSALTFCDSNWEVWQQLLVKKQQEHRRSWTC